MGFPLFAASLWCYSGLEGGGHLKGLIMEMESEFFDTKELAVYLNCSKKFIEKHRAGGRIPGAVKVGYSWKYRKNEIEKRLLSGQLLLDKK